MEYFQLRMDLVVVVFMGIQALVKMLGRSIGMALAPCCWCRSVRKGLMEPESARA